MSEIISSPLLEPKQSNEQDKKQGGIQVIARAANILRTLEHEQAGLSLGEIAKRVHLPRSTVQRIVDALAHEQLLISATPKARVVLGPAIVRLASSVRMDIIPLLKPVLQHLSTETNETVDLSILKGTEAVFVDQISGSHRLRAISAVGESFPLHCTACGKAMIAQIDIEGRASLLREELPRYTQNTKIQRQDVLSDIDNSREGIFFDHEEHTAGVTAIGVGCKDAMDNIYAISMPVPTSRFENSKTTLVRLMGEARVALHELLAS